MNLSRGKGMLVFGCMLVVGMTQSARAVQATGGDATNDLGGYRIHLFTNSAAAGEFVVTAGGNVECLVVAGGGGGGYNVGGGGGAGGLILSNVFPMTVGTYPVTVGAGGAGAVNAATGSNGGASTFGPLAAIGGGGGGSYSAGHGAAGGSGGGGAGYTVPGDPGPGTPGQGNRGGSKAGGNTALTGGGGGGAGGAGASALTNATGFAAGGAGVECGISGTLTTYAAGGAGSGNNWTGSMAGAPCTGNGGDGAGTPDAGKAGGSGIVMARYLLVPQVRVQADPASPVGMTNATLHATVLDTAEAENPQIYFCWGDADAGTNSLAGWLHADFQGSDWGIGQSFSMALDGLYSGSSYVYRCFASNSVGTAWSEPQSFRAGISYYVALTNNGTTNGTSWATAFTDIQMALDRAGNHDLVYIRGGVYPVTNQLVLTNSGVSILGAYEGTDATGPGNYSVSDWPTILARPGGTAFTNRILMVSGVSGGMLSRLSLTNGWLSTARAATGACLLVEYSADLLLDSLTLAGGNAYSLQPLVAGGGVFLMSSTNVTLSGCTIRDNWGHCGNNDSIRGSGVYAVNTTLTITNCLIKNNSGGSYVATGADHGAFGAGLHIKDSFLYMADTSIRGNYGNGHSVGVSMGAGVYVDGGTSTFRNCLIAGNDNRIATTDPSFRGDGVYVKGGLLTVANCTLIRNNGEGIYRAGGLVVVTNSIVWDNGDDLGGFPADGVGALAGVAASCIEDGDNSGTNGCISADPLFERGLYLADGSPCLDAGGSTAAEAGLADRTTRADGAVDAGTVDMGYHFGSGILDSPLAELYVDPAGSDANSGADPAHAFRSITRALSLATHGSRIHLASGLYTTAAESFPLTIHSLYGVELLGTNAATTVVKATGAGRAAIFLRGAGYVRLEGFGVTGGTGTGAYPLGGGLGIIGSRLVIASCIISNNIPQAPATGGGIGMKNTFLLMTNTLVARNGMSIPGGSVPWAYGGGVFAVDGELTLLDSVVVSNTAGSRGLSRGGGICLGGNFGGQSHLISNCVVAHNTASSIGGSSQGGGLFLMGTTRVVNVVIAANAAITNAISTGGGVFIGMGIAQLRNEQLIGSGDTLLLNTTIADNVPEGVRQNTVDDLLAIRNSILWNNGDDLVSSNMQAMLDRTWYNNIKNGDNAGTNGCFSADPLFANPSSDWHLMSHGGRWTPRDVWVKDPLTSPCIDAGDPASDYALEPEPNGRRINLGAYGNTAQASKKTLMTGSLLIIR